VIHEAETWKSKMEKNINDVGKKDIEGNIWTNKIKIRRME
jgi:hypothetical protein